MQFRFKVFVNTRVDLGVIFDIHQKYRWQVTYYQA